VSSRREFVAGIGAARNVRIDYRWGLGDANNIRKYAWELVALMPDVILLSGTATVSPLLQATRTVPIVFTTVADPVGAGFVDSLARPGGNITGFMQFEHGISGKWLELLKEIAPGLTRNVRPRCGTRKAILEHTKGQIQCPSFKSASSRTCLARNRSAR
jgi:ABC-type uncharacterized transport system substrate-binding protein